MVSQYVIGVDFGIDSVRVLAVNTYIGEALITRGQNYFCSKEWRYCNTALVGLNLETDAAQLFKALVEATAYGSRSIVERFVQEGVPIRKVIAIGRVAKKSPYVMQTLAKVFKKPILVARADQVCALGAAKCASVAAGAHPILEAVQRVSGSGLDGDTSLSWSRGPCTIKLSKISEPG